jgi:hypothetical protein
VQFGYELFEHFRVIQVELMGVGVNVVAGLAWSVPSILNNATRVAPPLFSPVGRLRRFVFFFGEVFVGVFGLFEPQFAVFEIDFESDG